MRKFVDTLVLVLLLTGPAILLAGLSADAESAPPPDKVVAQEEMPVRNDQLLVLRYMPVR
jgi:hypothetical protein